MNVGNIEWAQSVAGVVSPVLSALVLALVMYLIRRYLPNEVRGQVEKSVSEAENGIKRELQNGITDRLDHIASKVDSPPGPSQSMGQLDVTAGDMKLRAQASEAKPEEAAPESPFVQNQ
jgi:hypothetical protein